MNKQETTKHKILRMYIKQSGNRWTPRIDVEGAHGIIWADCELYLSCRPMLKYLQKLEHPVVLQDSIGFYRILSADMALNYPKA